MDTRWTEADLQVIASAVASENGQQILTDHFGPRGAVELARACETADDLGAGRPVSAGNGLMLVRDAPTECTGRVMGRRGEKKYVNVHESVDYASLAEFADKDGFVEVTRDLS